MSLDFFILILETQMESVIDSEIAPYTTMEESEDIGYGSIRTNGHDGPLTEQQSFKLPPNGIRPHNQQQTALNFSQVNQISQHEIELSNGSFTRWLRLYWIFFQTEDGLIGGEKRNKRRSEVIGNFRVRYDEISSRQEEMDKIVNDWPSSAQNGTSSGASQPSDCHGRTNDLERNGLAKCKLAKFRWSGNWLKVGCSPGGSHYAEGHSVQVRSTTEFPASSQRTPFSGGTDWAEKSESNSVNSTNF